MRPYRPRRVKPFFHLLARNYTLEAENAGITSKYIPVIGLEIHAQIHCKNKLFSSANTEWDQSENSQIKPLDLAIPGALPVLNKEALKKSAKTVLALNGTVQKVSFFERKHYFYHDQPLGYQITQQRAPIGRGGYVNIYPDTKTYEPRSIRIHQIQIEQDTAKTINDAVEGCGLIDYNRSGVGLMEIITKPDIRNSKEAGLFLKNIIQLLQLVGGSKALMEEGSLRCDVNISIVPQLDMAEMQSLEREKYLTSGTRCEIKNLNSIKSVVGAIDHEIERQAQILKDGMKVTQETRNYDIYTRTTKMSRNKEAAPDYRFIRDANIPRVVLSDGWVRSIRNEIPELPDAIRSRLTTQYGLTHHDVDVLFVEAESVKFFDKILEYDVKPRDAIKWITGELFGLVKLQKLCFSEPLPITPEGLSEIIHAITASKITTNMGKNILAEIFRGDNRAPLEIAKAKNWVVEADEVHLASLCNQVVLEHPVEVKRFRETNNKKVLGFLISQAIKKSNGTAKPQLLSAILGKMLK